MSIFKQKGRKRAGLSRIDLVVAVVVLVIALGVAIPGCQRVRDNGSRTATFNNLSQCAKAVHLCHDQYKMYPPYFGVYGPKTAPLTFHTHVLPFVDQGPLYNNPVPTGVVPAYLSTMDPTQTNNGANACNFPVNLRLFYTRGGLGELSSQKDLIYPKMAGSFMDGVSQTLLFATKYMNCGSNGGSLWLDPGNNAADSPTAATFGVSMALWQDAPTQAACDPTAGTAVGFTVRAIQIAMCDASVRSVASGISQATWQAVHTPSGMEGLRSNWED